jgi:Tfp pilus assembly protein PilE
LAPLNFARYLIVFFIGVIATLAWQSYRDGAREETISAAPASLDSVRQSIDRLAIEMTKLQAAEQDILDKISTPASRPAPAPARNPVPRSSSWPFH